MGDGLLLTGATGHLGAAILAELSARGAPFPALRLLVRSPEKLDRLAELSAEMNGDLEILRHSDVVTGDLRDEAFLDRALDGVATVVHTAHSHEYWRGSRYLAEVNVGGAERLLRAAGRAGVRRILTIGSYSAHPAPATAPSVDELLRLAPRACSSKAKLVTARLFADAAERDGFALDVVSPSYMIGPYQFDPTYFGALFHLVLFRPLTWAPPHGVNLVDVRDVARTVVDVLGAEGGRSVLASGDDVPFAELFEIMNRVAGRPRTPRTIPARWLRLVPRLRQFGEFGKRYFDRPHYVDAPGLPDRRFDLTTTVANAVEWARRMEMFSGSREIYRWVFRRYR